MNNVFIFIKNHHRLYAICHILISSIISLLVASILYPDLLIGHKYSFIRFSDSEIDYYGVFAIVSNFFHGKIQLWDNYDLMPLAYFYLNGGLTSFSNLFTALIYIIFSPFSRYPAEFFHSTYSVIYFFSLILIRSSGFYLLLKRFISNNLILLFSTVFASTFLAPQTYLGLNNSNIFCFYPLVIHFILRVFETWKLRNFLYAVLSMVVCIGSYPFMGMGYFYLGIHFTIISIIIYFLASRKIQLKKSTFRKVFQLNKRVILSSSIVILIGIAILIPFVYMMKENYKDYDFAHENSRFANLNIFDVTNYFKRDTETAYQGHFFYRMVNYMDNMWETQWLYLGITALFLTLCGIIFSNDKRKYIFFVTAIFFYFINSPREMYSISSIAHWIVALTDPFNFTLRTFHMTGALMLPFVLVPLITLGLESLFYIHKYDTKTKFIKLLIMAFVIEGIYISIDTKLPPEVNYSLLWGFILFIFLLYISFTKSIDSRKRAVFISLIIGLSILVDGYGMYIYFSSYLKKVAVIPQQLPYTKESVFIDYQNPYILPYREFYTTDNRTYKRYYNNGVYNNQGLYFHFTNFANYFIPSDIYHPKHISFNSLSSDLSLQSYLLKDNRIVYDAQLAVLEKEGLLSKLLANNQDRNIILIDRIPEKSIAFSSTLPDNLSQYKTTLASPTKNEISLDFTQIYHVKDEYLDIYEFKLPADFPKHLATGVFTDDISQISLTLGNKEYIPAQGKLISPYTFDISNIKSGKLFVALPKSSDTKNLKGLLSYSNNNYNGKLTILKYEPDNFKFTYFMDSDGWLVLHYPYDPHFKVTLDGVKSPIYKVNSAFIGIPLTKGSHDIYLQYWPDTWLRKSLGLSMILLFILPIYLVWIGITESEDKQVLN